MFGRNLTAAGVGALLAVALPVGARGAPAGHPKPEALRPCYIMLATDTSSSMNYNDPLIETPEGERALRDEAQVIFLQYLWTRHYRSYVAAAQFSTEVEHAYPPKAQADKTPLMHWHAHRFDATKVLAMVRSVKPAERRGTSLVAAMAWARGRVQQARRLVEPGRPPARCGQALLIVLSDGDPDNASKELIAPTAGVLRAADETAKANIRIFPIIINRASVREGRQVLPLRKVDRDAELLMDELARRTGTGKAFRLGELDALEGVLGQILNQVAQAPPMPADLSSFSVSRYHGLVLFADRLRRLPAAVALKAGADPPGPQLPIPPARADTEKTGIQPVIIPLTRWGVIWLFRPEDQEKVRQFWSGRWTLKPKASGEAFRGWLERVPDFLISVTVEPGEPWLVHEQGRIRAQLYPRPALPGLPAGRTPDLTREPLKVHVKVVPAEGGDEQTIELDIPAQPHAVKSRPFGFSRPGRYKVFVECLDAIGKDTVVVAHDANEVTVRPLAVGFRLIGKARGGSAVWHYPPPPDARQGTFRAGDEVYGELTLPGGLTGAELRVVGTAIVLPFKAATGGRHVTSSFTAPKGAAALHLEVHLTLAGPGPGRPRRIVLPLTIPLGEPVAMEAAFSDWRESLWLNEKHRQAVTLRLKDLTPQESRYFQGVLPAKLSDARMRVTAGQAEQRIGVTCRLADGYPRAEGSDLLARYDLAAVAAIDQLGTCEIDLGMVLSGATIRKEYRVLDPIATKRFRWWLHQGQVQDAQPGRPATMKTGQPVKYLARWDKARLDVGGVEFVVRPTKADEGRAGAVALNLDAANGQAERELAPGKEPELLGWLRDGQRCEVDVRVKLRPQGKGRAVLDVLLLGPPFDVREPWPTFAETVVEAPAPPGPSGPIGLIGAVGAVGAARPAGSAARPSCRALERSRLTVRQWFTDLDSRNPRHAAVLDVFKRSAGFGLCWPDLPDRSIVWKPGSLTWSAEQGDASGYSVACTLDFVPTAVGPVELICRAQIPMAKGDANTHLPPRPHRVEVLAPRISVKVHRIEADGRVGPVLLDSDKWLAGDPNGLYCDEAYSGSRVRLSLTRPAEPEAAEPPAWKLATSFVRQPAEGEPPREPRVQEVLLKAGAAEEVHWDLAEEGTYSLCVRMMPGQGGVPPIEFETAALIRIGMPWQVTPVLLASNAITSRVRQWPFEYVVTPHHRGASEPTLPIFEMQFATKDASGVTTAATRQGEWIRGQVFRDLQPGGEVSYRLLAPPFLMPPEALEFGSVRFRLQVGQRTVREWEHKNVEHHEPVLSGVRYFRRGPEGDDRPLGGADGNAPLDADCDLVAEIDFRMAADLAQWHRRDANFYVIRDTEGRYRPGSLDPEALDDLAERVRADDRDVAVVPLVAGELFGKRVVRSCDDRPRPCLWFDWGGKRRYAVLLATTYAEPAEASRESSASMDGPSERLIREWSLTRVFEVDEDWRTPYMLWLLYGPLAVWILAVQLLRLAVPKFVKLGVIYLFDPQNVIEISSSGGSSSRPGVWEAGIGVEVGIYSGLASSGVAGVLDRFRNTKVALLRSVVALPLMVAVTWIAPAVYSLLKRLLWPARWGWVRARRRGDPDASWGYVSVRTSLRHRKSYAIASLGPGGASTTFEPGAFDGGIAVPLGSPEDKWILTIGMAPKA